MRQKTKKDKKQKEENKNIKMKVVKMMKGSHHIKPSTDGGRGG